VDSERNSQGKIFSIRKIKNQRKWTKEEDTQLIKLALKFNEKHWKEISRRFTKKNSLQCFSRYKRIRPGIIKGSWRKEEDKQIIELVKNNGKSWSKIAKILSTRNGKQIRDRFINVLDPEIKKGKFTKEEDEKLVSLYLLHGPKWATISKCYNDRTADMIKNRFHSSIKRKVEEEYKTTRDESMTSSPQKENSFEEIKTNPQAAEEQISVKEFDMDKKLDSSFASKFLDLDFYSLTSNSNFELLSYDKESSFSNNSFNFSFEDYFTI